MRPLSWSCFSHERLKREENFSAFFSSSPSTLGSRLKLKGQPFPWLGGSIDRRTATKSSATAWSSCAGGGQLSCPSTESCGEILAITLYNCVQTPADGEVNATYADGLSVHGWRALLPKFGHNDVWRPNCARLTTGRETASPTYYTVSTCCPPASTFISSIIPALLGSDWCFTR